jgi:hypothetical protein
MASSTKVRQHRWVKYSVEPVDVIVAPDGTPYSVVRPGQPIGEQVGCYVCSEPLNSKSAAIDCLGFDTNS